MYRIGHTANVYTMAHRLRAHTGAPKIMKSNNLKRVVRTELSATFGSREKHRRGARATLHCFSLNNRQQLRACCN